METTRFARRRLLCALSSLVGSAAIPRLGHAFTALSGKPSASFSLGVASGSPTEDGCVLWTRLTNPLLSQTEATLVNWEVFDLKHPSRILAAGKAEALPQLAHSVHAEVTGLAPNLWFGYRFRVGRELSPIGRGRTLPLADDLPERLRFAYASCQHWESGYFTAYRHMQAEQLDFVAFLGDYIYEGGSGKKPTLVRNHGTPTLRTLHDYRARYALYKSDPYLQAMHAQCPWLVTWDDHEVQNDYAGTVSIYGTDDFLARRAAAYQAYYEHMPLRASAMLEGLEGLYRGAELKLYGTTRFGKLAALHTFDSRQYREPPVCPAKPSSAMALVCGSPSTSRTMLGSKQEQWLDSSFQSEATRRTAWNVLLVQSRVTPENYRHGLGKRAAYDSWDGYPEARQGLLNSIRRHQPKNPLFIGGDIHQNWVARVHANPYDVGSPVIANEFVGTSISSSKRVSPEELERRMADNPHCQFSNTDKRGYGVVEISPATARVDLRAVDDVRDERSGIATLASFSVADGESLRQTNPDTTVVGGSH